MSSRSAKVSARITPIWRKKASYIRSAPASAPVWEEAARAPDSDRPTLNTTMGLPHAAARSAARRKASGRRSPSM